MLVYMSQYVDERSPSPAPVPLKSSTKPTPPKSKRGKINFVSKASLAIFDPRHAMGIDTGHDWYDSDCHTPNSRSSFEHTSQRTARRSEDATPFDKWSTSPTPELEAFTASMDDYTYTSSGAAGTTEMTRQPSASSSVFEDDRDIPETPSRRRFYSRKSTAPSTIGTSSVASSYPTDDILFSPLGTKPKAQRSAGAGVTPSSASTSSSFARFFARKKKDKAPHLSSLASRSTPDLFDGVPHSAPPTTLIFEQSGFQFSPQRKTTDSSSLHSSPSSLPTSPERQPLRLVHDFSPSRTSPLSKKKSMPALRQIREAHNALGAAQNRSIALAMPEERSRPRQSMANSRSDVLDIAPALPPLPSFDTSSPMIPTEFAWDSKRGTVRESQMPSLGSNTRPVSRVVSSTGRGVPSPGLNPIRLNDLRKSTITLRNEPALRFAEDTRSQPSGKPTVGKSIASMRGNTNARSAATAEKRMSMAQRVVDGLLDQNHGREEPEMRARRSDMEVKSARRRSRSADGRPIPSHKLPDLTSPPSSNSHADSVFPAFVRHAPVAPGRSNSPQPHFFADADSATAVTPTPKQAPSFATPTSASPNKSPIRNTVQTQSPASRFPQRQNSGETHQARRVNFAGQRAKAVAVASPLLLSRSPLMTGRSGTPLPVVNIMPPTPDLAANDEDKGRQEAALQRYESVAAEATKLAKAATTSSSPVRAQGAPAGRVLPSRQETATSTTKAIVAAPTKVAVAAAAPASAPSAPTKPVQSAPVMVMSPESVYSPASIYSPEMTGDVFASLHAGLFGSDDAMSKEEMEITADSVAAELSYVGMPRTDSVTSQLSEVSSNRSSSSGAFAFSRSMSNSSLVSGGTFSSASSNASESPERKMNYLPSSTSFDFSPTKMSSSASLASTAGTSIFELEAEMRGVVAGKANAETDPFGSLGLTKLNTPFQLKGTSVGASAAQSASGAADSSDCETPTLASCRQMGATAVPQQQQQQQQQKAAVNRQLGLSMDLSDLAQELGLGRLSQIGLAHLKGVESLADKPVTAGPTMALGTVNAGVGKKISPIKPPKSSARATSAAAATGAATGLSRFGAGMNDIVSSAAMSPLPVSIAGRSPQTPPRTKAPLVEAPGSGRKVSASGVPKAEGGFGLGLNFAESPSPQAAPRKAAITPGSYAQHVVEQTQTIPAQYYQPHHLQQQHYAYQEEEEAEWVGVAM
ncbi:uncharacterized protein UTRI_03720 [Ustilago trichophora]|uniref:Uncharacterized protein n=1 Tax=Ustilago trichophora TaxID=86804 RepID=A0A5C3E1X8_9BASI|nr:uncharacterized protein UTRI_03720 [Ustilago trichophora]